MDSAQYLYSLLHLIVGAHSNIILTTSTFSISGKLRLQDAFSWPVERHRPLNSPQARRVGFEK